jgi:hypothetical protein
MTPPDPKPRAHVSTAWEDDTELLSMFGSLDADTW